MTDHEQTNRDPAQSREPTDGRLPSRNGDESAAGYEPMTDARPIDDADLHAVEAILVKYRPAEAPEHVLNQVEQAVIARAAAPAEPAQRQPAASPKHRPIPMWGAAPRSRARGQAALSFAAELLLGLLTRTILTATTFIVLLLIASGGQ